MTRVALVTQDLSEGGGLATMTATLAEALRQPPAFDVDVLSLAVSSRDALSARLASPATWTAGARVEPRRWRDLEYRHVGAVAPEFDPCRYAPRAPLTSMLRQFDLIQFVTATAAWAYTARDVEIPVSIWAATTTTGDRGAMVSASRGLRRMTGLLSTPILQRLERKALERATLVHALSQYTADGMQQQAPGVEPRVTPCGVDTSLYTPSSTSGAHTDGYIISVARFIDPRKNVALLIQAYADAVVAHPTVPDLWLVGKEPSDADLQLIRDLGLSSRVRLCGVMVGHELADLYRGASWFVLSSLEEGLAIVVLEAMASGLPVMSTRCGGPEMVIEQDVTGLLVPNNDRAALARAIVSMCEDPDRRRRFSSAARARAVEEYSFEVFARRFRESYATCGA